MRFEKKLESFGCPVNRVIEHMNKWKGEKNYCRFFDVCERKDKGTFPFCFKRSIL